MQYRGEAKRDLRQIANALGVANVLEGTVRREGNRVRVSTELIDAHKDQTIWADSYDRDLNGIFAIQSEVAQTIAAKLAATLSPTEKKSIEAKPTENLEAYDSYLRGKALLFNGSLAGATGFFGGAASDDQLAKAIVFLERAVHLDPSFALAYCAIANANDYFYFWFDQTPERLASAEAAISAALRLQPDLAEVHLAYAEHFYRGYRNYDSARVQLAIAKRGLPNSVEVMHLEGWVDRRQGNFEKAIEGFKEALARDPRNLQTLADIAETLILTRKFDAAVPLYDRIIDLQSDNPIQKLNKVISTRYWKAGDSGVVWSAIKALSQSETVDPDVLQVRLLLSFVEHDWMQAEQLIEEMKGRDASNGFSYADRPVPVECYAVLMERLREHQPAPNPAFAGIREQLNSRVLKSPLDAELLSEVAVLDALLNDKETAISEGKRAAEMLPISKDALKGPGVLLNLAVVYAWTGELDLAFDTLGPLTKIPRGIFYGQLKREPYWEPLRQDPRYDKLLAELAPKD